MSTVNHRNYLQIDLDFFAHRKTKRVARALTIEPPHAAGLIGTLLAAVARQNVGAAAETGSLPDWTDEDIADEAGWTGDAPEFVNALRNSGWLEDHDGVLYVHDWVENQPHWADRSQRSAMARKAAKARWDKERATATSMRGASASQQSAMRSNARGDEDVDRDEEGEGEESSSPRASRSEESRDGGGAAGKEDPFPKGKRGMVYSALCEAWDEAARIAHDRAEEECVPALIWSKSPPPKSLSKYLQVMRAIVRSIGPSQHEGTSRAMNFFQAFRWTVVTLATDPWWYSSERRTGAPAIHEVIGSVAKWEKAVASARSVNERQRAE